MHLFLTLLQQSVPVIGNYCPVLWCLNTSFRHFCSKVYLLLSTTALTFVVLGRLAGELVLRTVETFLKALGSWDVLSPCPSTLTVLQLLCCLLS